ncbi:YciI family protein [Neptunicella marina]|uniref:YciI family protein n=1 Tax=Neptunicella marina TaxID=2125989 RepID=A0A8J6IS79_9ALTE|nr:YciI family protein [Neptunicella marina]MBC3764636.1 YciI family protein [Neptunicella marina]
MKFMLLMIPNVYQPGSNPTSDFTPDPQKMEEMGRFNEELGKRSKITDLNGLQPQLNGARVAFNKGHATVTDGPSIESKEVLGGYWMIEADSKEAVVEMMQQCPAEDGDIIEIRQIFEFEE